VLTEAPDIARRQALVAWAADQWAGSDVGRAARLEEALLQEMRRRARQTAPATRDEWESVLAERGIPRAAARRQLLRRARTEWLEQQRRQDLLLANVYVAKLGRNSPNSPGSPVNVDFIADTLSRKASPFVHSVVQRERRMLTAILERPAMAALLLEQLPPTDMLLPIHRDIASAVAQAATADGPVRVTAVTDLLAQDEDVLAAAVDIALAEDTYDATTLERDIEAIREARLLGDKDIRLYNVKQELVRPEQDGESLAELEKQVQAGLTAGTLSKEDTLYRRYLEIRRQLHGSGELPYWDLD
jgi:hypothetical protein